MTLDYITFMRIAIFVLALCGFFIARHIRVHKKKDVPLVCPIRFDCHSVVHSDYSKFLGMPLELLGMIYYGVLSTCYFLLIFHIGSLPSGIVGFLAIASIVAFLFSLYLIMVQIFILKKGCSWCFVSAGICILIFMLTIYAYNVLEVVGALF